MNVTTTICAARLARAVSAIVLLTVPVYFLARSIVALGVL